MARIPRVVPLPDGKVSVRVEFPSAMWKVIDRFAQETQIPVESAIRMMFRQIARRFDEGDAMFLSGDFQDALRVVREQHFGVINEASSAIDLNRVHKSERTKSGFVGVYANGKGFRAMARGDNGTTRSIGTYPTAEEAAWRRYLYYKQNSLPYGELEIEMEVWRAGKAGGGPFKGTDEELIEEIEKHSHHAGTYEEIFGADGGNRPRKSSAARSVAPPAKAAVTPIGIDPSAIDSIFGATDE